MSTCDPVNQIMSLNCCSLRTSVLVRGILSQNGVTSTAPRHLGSHFVVQSTLDLTGGGGVPPPPPHTHVLPAVACTEHSCLLHTCCCIWMHGPNFKRVRHNACAAAPCTSMRFDKSDGGTWLTPPSAPNLLTAQDTSPGPADTASMDPTPFILCFCCCGCPVTLGHTATRGAAVGAAASTPGRQQVRAVLNCPHYEQQQQQRR